MRGRGYVGIDESNHGRFPEVFVAVYSENPADIAARECLRKMRERKEDILSLLEGKEFRYILIPEEEGKALGVRGIQLAVLSEFLLHFGPLELVIVDGEIPSHVLEETRSIVGAQIYPRIRVEPKADITYPLVNAADGMASLLHRLHAKPRNMEASAYRIHLLRPRIEGYAYAFEEQKRTSERRV